ncbi:hypothetical protein GCM10007315_31420 [Gemmobacter tilapiae]|uniref:Uncharacterized protein n=1 Tax=Neogemmobacter tilapiae TaxID=875041 RepID=A0A918TW40_9RHOB|nr:hypothetical protein GCM10007315_31420 [Gemmobacter tilapiae]
MGGSFILRLDRGAAPMRDQSGMAGQIVQMPALQSLKHRRATQVLDKGKLSGIQKHGQGPGGIAGESGETCKAKKRTGVACLTLNQRLFLCPWTQKPNTQMKMPLPNLHPAAEGNQPQDLSVGTNIARAGSLGNRGPGKLRKRSGEISGAGGASCLSGDCTLSG